MATPSRHILLIDDEAAVREPLAELLAAEGYRVTCAADGREGLRRAVEDRPNLILLDLSMPVMDGWTFRAHQLADPWLAGVPVVILSASHGAELPVLARLRPAAFVQKPVELDRLRALIQRHADDGDEPHTFALAAGAR